MYEGRSQIIQAISDLAALTVSKQMHGAGVVFVKQTPNPFFLHQNALCPQKNLSTKKAHKLMASYIPLGRSWQEIEEFSIARFSPPSNHSLYSANFEQ